MATPENILEKLIQTPQTEPESPPPAEPDPPSQAEDTGADVAPPEPEAAPASDEPIKLADLASQLDLTPEKLFGAVNSEGHTASDAFKALKEHRDIDAERIELERGQNSLRVEKAHALEELQSYMALLPQGQVDQALADKMQAAKSTVMEQKQAALLARVPEWKDPSVKQADVDAMTGYVQQFGALPADLGNVAEPWVLQMIRHNARLEVRIKNILERAEKPAPKGVKRGTGKPDKPASGKKLDVADLVNKGLRQ